MYTNYIWHLYIYIHCTYCVCMQMICPPIVITGKLNRLIFCKTVSIWQTQLRCIIALPSCFIENMWHWFDTHIQQQVGQLRTLDHARAILPADFRLLHDCTGHFIGEMVSIWNVKDLPYGKQTWQWAISICRWYSTRESYISFGDFAICLISLQGARW